jgi:chromosome segregation ATPase
MFWGSTKDIDKKIKIDELKYKIERYEGLVDFFKSNVAGLEYEIKYYTAQAARESGEDKRDTELHVKNAKEQLTNQKKLLEETKRDIDRLKSELSRLT